MKYGDDENHVFAGAERVRHVDEHEQRLEEQRQLEYPQFRGSTAVASESAVADVRGERERRPQA